MLRLLVWQHLCYLCWYFLFLGWFVRLLLLATFLPYTKIKYQSTKIPNENRCLDRAVLYPPENPIVCHYARPINDTFVVGCCKDYDHCNRDLKPILHVKNTTGNDTTPNTAKFLIRKGKDGRRKSWTFGNRNSFSVVPASPTFWTFHFPFWRGFSVLSRDSCSLLRCPASFSSSLSLKERHTFPAHKYCSASGGCWSRDYAFWFEIVMFSITTDGCMSSTVDCTRGIEKVYALTHLDPSVV